MNTTHGRRRFAFLRNWLSAAGFVIALGGFFAFLLLFAIDLFAHHGNPYMGILAYVVAPGFMFAGIGLAFIGFWLQRRQAKKTGAAAAIPSQLRINLSRPRDRKLLVVF